jgi:hypothetical protein
VQAAQQIRSIDPALWTGTVVFGSSQFQRLLLFNLFYLLHLVFHSLRLVLLCAGGQA